MTAEFPRVRNRRRTRSVIIASVVGLLVASAFVVGVVVFASKRPNDVNLGDKRFVVGSAKRFAERIDSQRTPILFKDPLTSRTGRELYVQHLGNDVRKGWLAVDAYAPGQRKLDCILRWNARGQEFRDRCSNETYPKDGTGLRTYPGTVDANGIVVIDLRTRSAVPPS